MGLQATEAMEGKPSVLVAYKRTDRSVQKIIELWVDKDTPFTGNCGGVAVTKGWIWVTDDSDQAGMLVGFPRGDLEAEIDKRAPMKLFVGRHKNTPVMLELGYTASHVSFDFNPKQPRLWVSERMIKGSGDEEGVLTKSGGYVSNLDKPSPQTKADNAAPRRLALPSPASEASLRQSRLNGCLEIVKTNLKQNFTPSSDEVIKMQPECCKEFGSDPVVKPWPCKKEEPPTPSPSMRPSKGPLELLMESMAKTQCQAIIDTYAGKRCSSSLLLYIYIYIYRPYELGLVHEGLMSKIR